MQIVDELSSFTFNDLSRATQTSTKGIFNKEPKLERQILQDILHDKQFISFFNTGNSIVQRSEPLPHFITFL